MISSYRWLHNNHNSIIELEWVQITYIYIYIHKLFVWNGTSNFCRKEWMNLNKNHSNNAQTVAQVHFFCHTVYRACLISRYSKGWTKPLGCSLHPLNANTHAHKHTKNTAFIFIPFLSIQFLKPSHFVCCTRGHCCNIWIPVRAPKSFAHATLVTPQVSELRAWLISACTPSLLCD